MSVLCWLLLLREGELTQHSLRKQDVRWALQTGSLLGHQVKRMLTNLTGMWGEDFMSGKLGKCPHGGGGTWELGETALTRCAELSGSDYIVFMPCKH